MKAVARRSASKVRYQFTAKVPRAEGLLVQPTGDDFEINLEGLPEGGTVRGDWYPYEVQYEDILFIVDDDGSIFVTVENFPERLVVRVREQLHELARRIYG
jgi:hypothetical protein